MAAGINDRFTNASNGTRPSPTTLTAIRAVGASSISCGALTGWPTATAVHFVIYTTDTSGNKVAGSQLDCKGIVSGTSITNIVYKAGSDTGNVIGAIVEAAPTAAWADDVVAGAIAEHNQDGTHAAVTAASVTVAAGKITTTAVGKLEDAAVPLSTYRSEYLFPFIASGMVWSGDAYASTRLASMTAGVCHINGRRISISAVTSRTFTASKDTYIDVLDNADGTGTLVYTEVTNNAASPALAANSIRIGIIITGATTIAAASSINQGQETSVLPIASSIPYSVVDSLGNLICNRNPVASIIGYRQITSNFSTASSAEANVTGLSMPIIVPTGRRVKLTFEGGTYNQSGANASRVNIKEGSTVIRYGVMKQVALNAVQQLTFSITLLPTAGAHTYFISEQADAGNLGLEATATEPAFIRAELV